MKTPPTAEVLARKFSELLEEDIGLPALAEAVRRNGMTEYNDCCASHDFCDANMVMLAAVCEFGFTEDDVFENDCDNDLQKLWNEAWTLAKTNKFYL